MVRRSLVAALVLVTLACMVQHSHAARHNRRGRVASYLFGGYGPGPFGKGHVNYAGHPPIQNYTNLGRRVQ
jgi:hypothetical protein